MDNEAFRALVAERSRPKSTKEIAREAVEREFRERRSRGGGGGGGSGGRKRRRGGGGGGGSGGSSSDEGGGRGGGGRGGGGTDEDSDDDFASGRPAGRDGGRAGDHAGDGDGDGEKEPKWKQERRAKKRAKEAEGKVRYRDRARERREGRTNADYAGIEEAVAAAGAPSSDNSNGGAAVLGDAEADNMTKYLGGDESRTHLVRGLDWALAQRVRREEMGGTGDAGSTAEENGAAGSAHGGHHDGHDGHDGHDANLERMLQSSRAVKSEREALRGAILNLSSSSSGRNNPQGVTMLLTRLQSASQSTSGRDMATFLMNKTSRESKTAAGVDEARRKKRKLTTTNAGRTLQRAKLQFSLRCHPGDVLRSWEVPREEVSSVAEHERRRQRGADVPFGQKLTPFDGSFLTRMKAALAPLSMLASLDSTSKSLRAGTSKEGREGRKKSKHQEGGGGGEGNDDAIETIITAEDREHSSTAAGGALSANYENNDASESSDEDIFGGIGQYQPSAPTTSKDAAGAKGIDSGATKKTSIFDGLSAEPHATDKPQTSATVPSVPTAPSTSEKKNVIDRDVFGARPADKGTTVASGHRPSEGVSMSISDYAGGYGEEMDIDFSGADDEETSKGKKGSGGDLTTTAASEYGRRSGGARQVGS